MLFLDYSCRLSIDSIEAVPQPVVSFRKIKRDEKDSYQYPDRTVAAAAFRL